MTKLPDKLFGREVKGSLERALRKSESDVVQPTHPITQQNSLVTRANINLSDYVTVLGGELIIEKFQSQSNNGLNWEDTHYKLAENGLFMPTPYLMMKHLVNVINAKKGKIFLYDGSGKIISSDETEEIYQYLTKNNKGGVWTWLDAKFKRPSNSNQDSYDIETNHRVILNGSNKELIRDINRAQDYVAQECYVDLNFNQQGLPIKIPNDQKYQQGQNIYFYKPLEESVAWFKAYSLRAHLSCVEYPNRWDSGLGVLACAEITEKKFRQ